MNTYAPIPGETKFTAECRARGSLTLPRPDWLANSAKAMYLPDDVREAKAALEEDRQEAYLAGCEGVRGTYTAAQADKLVAAYFKTIEADSIPFPLTDAELDEIIAKRQATAAEGAVLYLTDARPHVANMLAARRAKNRKTWDHPDKSNQADPRLQALDDLIAECQFGPPSLYVFTHAEYRKLRAGEDATDVSDVHHVFAELDAQVREGRAKIKVVNSPPAREMGIAGLVEP